MERLEFHVIANGELMAVTTVTIDTELNPAIESAASLLIASLIGGFATSNQAKPPANQANPPDDPFRGRSNGLDKPRDETPMQRLDRIGAELERQRGYNAGLRGNPPQSEGEIYLAAHAKGYADSPMYYEGYGDGVAGSVKTKIDHYAYTVGYEEGSKAVKA